MKIYAIDDEKASLYFLCKAIKEAYPNDELKQFNNYKDFLEEFKKDLPDIAFLDVEMPEMNGIELAQKISEIKKDVNIIFCTAYEGYALKAFELNASSYIVKPANKEKIINSINNLRYKINGPKDIVIKTFGNFDIFYHEVVVKFRSPKSKEILAYLVDREGGLVSKKEIAAIVYEDDYSLSTQSALSRNIKYLEEDLTSAGIKDLFIINNGSYAVDLKKTSCDLIDYLNGQNNLFLGEYMEQYSFGEYRKISLSKKQNQKK